nr:MAG TPA: hypothetical protein [Caudoviricetes sp.]
MNKKGKVHCCSLTAYSKKCIIKTAKDSYRRSPR